jgi:hypothetical protein
MRRTEDVATQGKEHRLGSCVQQLERRRRVELSLPRQSGTRELAEEGCSRRMLAESTRGIASSRMDHR